MTNVNQATACSGSCGAAMAAADELAQSASGMGFTQAMCSTPNALSW